MAAHPALIGIEALALLAEANATVKAALVEEPADGKRRVLSSVPNGLSLDAFPAADNPVTVDLGTLGARRYTLLVRPLPTAASRATVLAVERLVQNSRALGDARQKERERLALWPEQTAEEQLGMIYAAQSMRDLIKTTRRVATLNITVLITGETGVGKELLARALHQASNRKERIFLPFNCTAVPREMLDSQLFGYRKGAFTGAHEDFPGIIRSAAGGTLFLDEIGEMSPDVQPKLLRFLESGEVLPLGEARPQMVDVRIVAATNANLDQMVAAGRFREDLYYRLNVIPLKVPPLRDRREEVPVLVEALIEKLSREAQRLPLRMAEETMEYLLLYAWPGNVRQLANELRRIAALSEPGAVVMPEHLSPEIAASRRTLPAATRMLAPTEVVVRLDQSLPAIVEHVERTLILHALTETGHNLEKASRLLGVSRKGLFLKRMKLGIG